MARITWRDFTKGLYVAGPREVAPAGTLRRGFGASYPRTGAFQSRHGSLAVRTAVAHSMFRFGDVRFYGVGTTCDRGSTTIKTGLGGTRLRFLRMPPTSGTDDYLFVAGGGDLFKVDADGAVTDWGIDPPADGMTAAKATQDSKVIEAFETAADYTVTSDPSDGSNAVSDETTIKIAGTNSMQFHVLKDTTAYAVKTFAAIDLSVYASGATSPEEDFILLWVHISRPQRVESIELQFSSAGTDFTNAFTKELLIEDSLSKKEKKKERGIGDLIPVRGQDTEFLAAQHSKPETLSINEQIGMTKMISTNDTWTRLRIPKAVFSSQGSPVWSDIRGIKVVVNTNARGAVDVYFDAMSLIGSVGMIGDYQMRVTFLDPDTGSRSNANTTPVEITDVERQGITLSNIPTSAGYHREIWRTVGNGSIYFLDEVIEDDSTTTLTLTNADYVGLYGNTDDVLQTEELPTDNLKPFATFTDVAGPHYGRCFWLDSVFTGRVYYSPAGRAEGVAGFIDLTDTDDPTKRLIVWNHALYCLTEGSLFEIIGTDEPFVGRRVRNAPGTTLPDTVVATPVGIVYRAADGFRLFNGAIAQRIGYDAFAPLFTGTDAEGLEPFDGLTACYANDEYIVGDSTGLYALSLSDERWRAFDLTALALFAEADTGEVLLSTGTEVVSLEYPGETTDNGAAITLDCEPAAQFTQAGTPAIIQRLFFEINTRGQVLTPSVTIDNEEFTLPSLVTNEQTVVTYKIDRTGRILSARLQGELTQPIDLIAIEADIYLPGS